MNPVKYHDTDVIVIGASLEGCIASIEAANKGNRVLLIENNGSLGQSATNGLNVYMPVKEDLPAKVKNYAEYILKNAGNTKSTTKNLYHDQLLKVVLQRMLNEAKVQVLTHVFLTRMNFSNGMLTGCRVGTKTGCIDVSAKLVIDATDKIEAGAAAGLEMTPGLLKVKAGIKLNQVSSEAIRKFADQVIEEEESILIGTAKYGLKRNCSNMVLSSENMTIYHDKEYNELILGRITAVLNNLNGMLLSAAQGELRKFAYALRDELRKNVKGFEKAHIINVSPRVDCYGIRKAAENPYSNLILVNNDVQEYNNLDAIALGIKAGNRD